MPFEVFNTRTGEVVGTFATETGAMAEVERRGVPYDYHLQSHRETVHALDITPAMREAAMAGLPLFSRQRLGD